MNVSEIRPQYTYEIRAHIILLTNGCCCLEFFLHNDLKIILPNRSHKTVNWVIM